MVYRHPFPAAPDSACAFWSEVTRLVADLLLAVPTRSLSEELQRCKGQRHQLEGPDGTGLRRSAAGERASA